MQQKSLSGPAFLGRAAAAFAVTFALLFVLLLAACCVPGAPVRRNIARSVPLLQQEGLYPEYGGFKLFQMDNYTDTIMLFEAAAMDGSTKYLVSEVLIAVLDRMFGFHAETSSMTYSCFNALIYDAILSSPSVSFSLARISARIVEIDAGAP